VMIFFVRMFAPIKGLFYLSQNVPNIFVKWYNYIYKYKYINMYINISK